MNKVVFLIWQSRKMLIISMICVAGISVLVALMYPKRYTATTSFIPQVSSSRQGAGGLSGLASLAGINLGSSASSHDIPPEIYPRIITSVTFRKRILDSKIESQKFNVSTTYREYFENLQKPSLLKRLIAWVLPKKKDDIRRDNSSKIVSYTKQEERLIFLLKDQLTVDFSEKEGVVVIQFEMQEPLIAAQMAQSALEILQDEIITYKIKNINQHLEYVQEQFDLKKAEFHELQERLAKFRDRNLSITSEVARNELMRIQSEYDVSFSVYTELANQLEQAKLQVNKDTPVFATIQPVVIPFKKSSPGKVFLFFTTSIVGFILIISFIFLRASVLELISDLNNQLDTYGKKQVLPKEE